LEILKSRLGQKRARLPNAAEEDEDDDEESVSDWDLADHRREATRVQNRRAIELGSRENVKELRRVQNGYIDHPRLGLIGCLAYWACGSMAHSVTMIAVLCVKLGISERVRDALPETRATRETATNAKIVALLKTGLGELKHCSNEQQRIQFVVGLSLVMPPRMEEGDSKGQIRCITDALGVKRGKRTAKYDARPYASDLAVMLINSSELRAACFTLRDVIPPALEAAARGGRRRYGVGLRQLQGMGPKRFVMSADNDNEFRSRCE